MDNVYDLVEDFYGHDPGWNFLLRREYAEGFLRIEAWHGKTPEELYDIWDQLTMLCLYLGNTELMLGDMSADDFVDCIAWCGRNVSEFDADYEHTKYFLDTCVRLYAYLQKKNVISDAGAPLEAEEKLLAGGKMNIVNPDGSFTDENKDRRLFTVPDASNKIFLNVNERMQEIYAAGSALIWNALPCCIMEFLAMPLTSRLKAGRKPLIHFGIIFCLITV